MGNCLQSTFGISDICRRPCESTSGLSFHDEREQQKNILLGVRLALKRGKIAEAEHHVVPENEIHLKNLIKPRPGLVEDISPEDRTPREQMFDIGLSYYDALTGEDGTLAPFAPECQRRENGGISVGGKKEAPEATEAKRDFAPPEAGDPEMMKLAKALSFVPNTCEGQITAGVWAYISEIRNRRLLVIDEQKGLAVGFSNLYHDSKLKNMKLKGVPGIESIPAFQEPSICPPFTFLKSKKARSTILKQLVSYCPTEPKPDGNRTHPE